MRQWLLKACAQHRKLQTPLCTYFKPAKLQSLTSPAPAPSLLHEQRVMGEARRRGQGSQDPSTCPPHEIRGVRSYMGPGLILSPSLHPTTFINFQGYQGPPLARWLRLLGEGAAQENKQMC